jgi:hypothetical protein
MCSNRLATLALGILIQATFVNTNFAVTNCTHYGAIYTKDANGTEHQIIVTLKANEINFYPNDAPDCATHKTSCAAPRVYAHFHAYVDLTAQSFQSGFDLITRTTVSITTNDIRRYWDAKFQEIDSGYRNTSNGPSLSCCHSYAFQRGCIIQDPSYIDADELQTATNYTDCKFYRNGSIHTIVKTGCLQVQNESANYYELYTSEQNCESDVYTNCWHNTEPPGYARKKNK